MKRTVYFAEGILQAFIGIGAVISGALLIIGPDGHVFRCHADLYEGREAIGHLLDKEVPLPGEFRECGFFGFCNPCDIKVKTNRFQEFGHTSVEIRQPVPNES